MLTKKDAKSRVEQIKRTMAHLIGVPVLICLGPHQFEMSITDLQLATLTGLAMTPDKVYNEETGKSATPQIMQILFSGGESINVVLDDIDDFSVTIGGALFKVGKEELKIVPHRKNSR